MREIPCSKQIEANYCFPNGMISVVMPVYNMEAYINEAIDSLLCQTFENFELIIIDDGSTDNTPNILKGYEDQRIRLILNRNNKGNYPCRNEGMSLAKGKYIAVADADDIYFPERFQIQFHYMENHPEALATGSNYIYSDQSPASKGVRPEGLTYEQIKSMLMYNNCIQHPSLMFRSDIIKETGGYDEKYIYSADYDLVCRIAVMGQLTVLPDILLQYRLHDNQISHAHYAHQQYFGRKIREKYVLHLIKHLNSSLPLPDKAHIAHSQMGYIIYLYHKAAASNEQSIENEADNLLNALYENLDLSTPLCMSDGLSGLGCGLMYLLRNNLVQGDEDVVLKDIDKAMRYAIVNDSSTDIGWYHGLPGLLNYLFLRIENRPTITYKQLKFNIKSLTLLIKRIKKIIEKDKTTHYGTRVSSKE